MARPAEIEQAPATGGAWGLGGAVTALFVSFAALYIGAQMLYAAVPSFYNRDELGFAMVSEQFLLVGVAAVVVYFAVRYRVGAASIGFRIPGGRGLLVAVGSIPVIYLGVGLIAEIFSLFFSGFGLQGNSQQTLTPNHEHVGSIERTIAYVWASVEAPLLEEILFRGMIFQGLRNFFARWLAPRGAVGAGAVVSGLAFGLVHFEPHTLPILAFVGVVLALVFQYARSIYASFLVHAIFNFLAVYSVFH